MNLLVINNFLSKKILNKINSLQLEKVFKTKIKVYPNLMTNRIKDVYKIENKNYFIGFLRYKINPVLYKYFKFNF